MGAGNFKGGILTLRKSDVQKETTHLNAKIYLSAAIGWRIDRGMRKKGKKGKEGAGGQGRDEGNDADSETRPIARRAVLSYFCVFHARQYSNA